MPSGDSGNTYPKKLPKSPRRPSPAITAAVPTNAGCDVSAHAQQALSAEAKAVSLMDMQKQTLQHSRFPGDH